MAGATPTHRVLAPGCPDLKDLPTINPEDGPNPSFFITIYGLDWGAFFSLASRET